jgi:hypothetical protein
MDAVLCGLVLSIVASRSLQLLRRRAGKLKGNQFLDAFGCPLTHWSWLLPDSCGSLENWVAPNYRLVNLPQVLNRRRRVIIYFQSYRRLRQFSVSTPWLYHMWLKYGNVWWIFVHSWILGHLWTAVGHDVWTKFTSLIINLDYRTNCRKQEKNVKKDENSSELCLC